MKVEISIDRSCVREKSTLGTQQENKFEKLEFTFPEEIKDYTKTIEFQTPDDKFIDKIENDEYIIKNNISKYECVQVQIIAIKEDKVFKSKIFDLYFYKSINATEEIPDEQPDLIHKMILDIENIKNDINNFSSYDDTELQNKITQLEKENALLKRDLEANQITETVEGESLALTDSSSARLVDFGIEGNSEQATRSGKNRLYLTKKETGTKNSVDYTIDGTKITLNGTTTKTTDIYFEGNWGSTNQNDKRFLKAGTYTFSCTGAKNNNRFSADIYQNTTNVISLAYKDVQTKTLSEDTYYSIFYISIPVNKTFNNETFEFQLEEGSTATDYEEYGASPSPDYPSEIKSCGDSGNIDLVKSNKNLLKLTSSAKEETRYGIKITIAEDGLITLNGTAIADIWPDLVWGINNNTIEHNKCKYYFPKTLTNVTFYMKIVGGASSKVLPITIRFNDLVSTDNNDIQISNKKDKVTKSGNLNGINRAYITIFKDTVFNNFKFYLQLEEGDTATDYIEHQEQNYTVPVQKPFRAIGDVRDRFVKQDGKRYEEHKIKRINSYNNEEITTAYMSNIGELSTGAVVDYVLETSELIECTAEQCRILDEIENSENYKELTYIYSTDEVQPNLKATYSKDLNAENKRLENRIVAIEELLSTQQTSALLLDNLQNDLEREVNNL